MLQVFFQNLLNKKYLGGVFVLLLSHNLFAQEKIPGLFETFNDLLQKQEKVFQKLDSDSKLNNFSRTDINDIKEDIRLNPDFINLILFNTPLRFHTFLKKDQCSLYDLLLTDLVELPESYRGKVYFDYRTKKGDILTASLPIDKFYKEFVNYQCPGVLKISKNFDLVNLRTTLSKLRVKFPENKRSCVDYFDQFKSDVTSPYLCHIVKNIEDLPEWERARKDVRNEKNLKLKRKLQGLIDRAQNYKKIMNLKVADKLIATCKYIDNPDWGCRELFQENHWAFILENNPASEILKTYCHGSNTKRCVNELSSKGSLCNDRMTKQSALTPIGHCKQIGEQLKNSRLKSNYVDCPGKTGNESLTTFSRILHHFNFYHTSAVSSCEVHSINPAAKFLEEYTELETWGLKICYDDKIKDKKVCYPFMMGDAKGSEFSLSNAVGKIASRLKGYNYQESPCEIIKQSEYKPALLKFKNGCFILRDNDFCTGLQCKFKVIISEAEFNSFEVERNFQANLYPYNYINEANALIRLLEKHKKLNVKQVQNITRFKTVLENHKDAIFVGVGCAEDLLPTFFERSKLNQCRALPFIVDNIFEERGEYAMLTRTSLDQIHAPRVIPWSHIFNALREYQLGHPINLWSFHAIYK